MREPTMKIEIYTGPECHDCEQAKDLLRREGLEFEEFNMADDSGYLQTLSARAPLARALPQVFVDDIHIGSYKELLVSIQAAQL